MKMKYYIANTNSSWSVAIAAVNEVNYHCMINSKTSKKDVQDALDRSIETALPEDIEELKKLIFIEEEEYNDEE